MKFTSQLLAAASGSIGGATFSRNRGGQYIRRRAVPSNPNSEAQGLARTNLATAVASWTNALTDAERQAWSTYAQSTPVIDSIGNSLLLSGQQMYVRSATIMLIAGLPIPTTGPTSSGLGLTPDWTAPPTVDASSQLIAGEITVIDGTGNIQILVYMSRPVPPSRTPAHETKRFADSDVVVGALPLNISFATPFAVTTGQLVRVTALAVDAQNRVSSISFRDVVVEA